MASTQPETGKAIWSWTYSRPRRKAESRLKTLSEQILGGTSKKTGKD